MGVLHWKKIHIHHSQEDKGCGKGHDTSHVYGKGGLFSKKGISHKTGGDRGNKSEGDGRMNQDTVDWLARQIREHRIQYKRLLRELHNEINNEAS